MKEYYSQVIVAELTISANVKSLSSTFTVRHRWLRRSDWLVACQVASSARQEQLVNRRSNACKAHIVDTLGEIPVVFDDRCLFTSDAG